MKITACPFLLSFILLCNTVSHGQNRQPIPGAPGQRANARSSSTRNESFQPFDSPESAGSISQSHPLRPGIGPDGSLDASSIFFEAFTVNSGGTEAISIATADVNGDGKPDVLIANQNGCQIDISCDGGTISVLLGNGDGTFQPAVLYNTGGGSTRAFAVADINGDGKLDLVAANFCIDTNCATGSVSVLFGNGDGTFQPAVSYASGGYVAISVAVADVNGDGIPDVVVANQDAVDSTSTSGTVGVLLGNGDGTFKPVVTYSSGGPDLYSVAVADVNGDGKPDLLIADECQDSGCANGAVGVMLGKGNGTFQPVVLYNSGGQYGFFVTSADVNGDGKPDLLVANICYTCDTGVLGSVGVLLNQGNGTFGAAVTYNSGGGSPSSIVATDVNGDGKVDLVVSNGGTVGILLNNGDGTFASAIAYGSAGSGAFSSAVSDINSDGKLDIVAVNECETINCQGSVAAILLGNGNGTFQGAPSLSTGGIDASSAAISDLNGDGKADLVVTNACADSACVNGSVGVFYGNGDGTFQTAVAYGSGGLQPDAVAVADFNLDGRPDLVVANQYTASTNANGSVGVLLGNTDGTFQAAVTFGSGGENAEALLVGDVNRDGIPDLVVVNECADSTCANSSIGVLRGNGDGTFQAAATISVAGLALSAALTDVNGDGKLDLIVATFAPPGYQGEITVSLGNGDGTFQPPVTYSSGGLEPIALTMADVNGDGYVDIVVGNESGNGTGNPIAGSIGVLLGNGNGTFQSALTFPTPQIYPTDLVVQDFNGDGKLDIAGGTFLLLGNGDGTFQNYQDLGVEGGPASGDFNNDGNADLAIPSGNGVIILLNRLPAREPVISVPSSADAGSVVLPGSSSISVTVTNTGSAPLLISSYSFQPPQLGAYIPFTASGCVGVSIPTNGGTCQIQITYSPADTNGDAFTFNIFSNATNGTASMVVTGTGANPAGTAGAQPMPPALPANAFAGQTTLAAQVTPISSGRVFHGQFKPSPPVGGSITFLDGSTPLGIAPVANGTATLNVTLTAGQHMFSLTYNGDPTYAPALSSPVSVTVTQAQSSTALSSSANPAKVNEGILLSATVSSNAQSLLNGTVAFNDGAVTLATVPVANGQASYRTSFSFGGTLSLTAVYSGDANNVGSTSPMLVESVVSSGSKASVTKLTTSGSPSVIGEAVTFTAAVSSTKGSIPNGENVLFYDGTTQIGVATTTGGIATLTTSSLSAKTHSIKATYGGDINFKTSSGVVTQIVEPYTTTTALSVNPNPSNYGQAVTLIATVSSTGSATPTGTVTFKNGTASLGTETLSAGMATLTTTKLPVGTASITALYNGDSSNGKSTSSSTSQTVNQAQVSMTLSSTPNPSLTAQLVKFTATFTSNGSLPAGSVTFTFNGTTLATESIVSGKAAFSTTTLPAGSDLITATYAGSADYTSTSATDTQTVNGTSIVVSSNLSPSNYGQNVTLTAQVTPSGTTMPTGTVTFKNGTTTLGSGTLNASGIATYATTKLAVGTDSITATYNGDSQNGKSTSAALTQIVNQAVINIALSSSPNPSTIGQTVKFTAMLSSSGGLPTGTITFSYNGSSLGTGTISGGNASFSIKTLPSGADQVTATYAGTADYSTATASITQNVN